MYIKVLHHFLLQLLILLSQETTKSDKKIFYYFLVVVLPTTGLIPRTYLWSLYTTAYETNTSRIDLQGTAVKQKHLSTSLDWTYVNIC